MALAPPAEREQVGQVGHVVHFAGGGGLVAAAGPAAVLVLQDHRPADRGGDLGAVRAVAGELQAQAHQVIQGGGVDLAGDHRDDRGVTGHRRDGPAVHRTICIASALLAGAGTVLT
jgi:hypothetical protein